MDLNIEGTGEVLGWSPPLGEVMTPGFKATMEALVEMETAMSFEPKWSTMKFIYELEKLGYCIARYDNGI